MESETTAVAPAPRSASPLDVIDAVQALLPREFRCSVHTGADSPHLLIKIRTLDNETYFAVSHEQRDLGTEGMAAAIKPGIDEIVATFRRLAPQ